MPCGSQKRKKERKKYLASVSYPYHADHLKIKPGIELPFLYITAVPWYLAGIPGEAPNAIGLRDQGASKPESAGGMAPLLPRRPAPKVPAIKKPTLRRTGKVRTRSHKPVPPRLFRCLVR